MQKNETLLILGRINGVFGIKGWVKVMSFTRPRENIFDYSSLLLCQHGEWQQARIEASQRRGDHLLLKLDGVDTPEAARQYNGCELALPRDELPALPDGQFYWHQLVGLKVNNLAGTSVGEVVDIRETGANDVLVVRSLADEKKKELIPLIMGIYIMKIDLEAGVMQVDWELE